MVTPSKRVKALRKTKRREGNTGITMHKPRRIRGGRKLGAKHVPPDKKEYKWDLNAEKTANLMGKRVDQTEKLSEKCSKREIGVENEQATSENAKRTMLANHKYNITKQISRNT